VEGEFRRAAVGRLLQRLARNELRRGLALLEANDASARHLFAAIRTPMAWCARS
jgi:hypothetical protein